jgi:cytidylate kinase
MNNNVNIALSGWSGAGTSTMAMMAALLLDRKYYYLGAVFREVVRRLENLKVQSLRFKIDGSIDRELPGWEAILQPTLGRLMDKYTDYVLLHESDLVLETDLSVFRIGRSEKVFSIFLKVDFEERARRFVADERGGDGETLRRRDEALRREYKKLYGIDVFDEELIERQFNLVVDTSRLNLAESLETVVADLQGELGLNLEFEEVLRDIDQYLGRPGKERLKEMLREKGLMVSAEELMGRMRKVFPGEIEGWPEEVREVFGN